MAFLAVCGEFVSFVKLILDLGVPAVRLGYKLKNAEVTIWNSQQQLLDGEKQIEEAKKTIADGEKQLEEGKATLEQTKAAAYEPVNNAMTALQAELSEAEVELAAAEAVVADLKAQIDAINAQIAESEARYNALNEQINQLNWQIASLDTTIASTQTSLNLAKLFPLTNAELIASLEARLSEQNAQRAEADALRQSLITERDPLQAQLQAGVPAAHLGVFRHGCHSLLPAYDDQQLPCPGNGGVENAAAQQIRRAVPGAQHHGPVL